MLGQGLSEMQEIPKVGSGTMQGHFGRFPTFMAMSSGASQGKSGAKGGCCA